MKKIIAIFFILFSFSAYSNELDELTKKADGGDAIAQIQLGLKYYIGKGIKQNYFKAFKYLKLAADQNNDDIYTMVGGMYYRGIGVTQNYSEALKYFKLAADKNATAQFLICYMYKYGKGTRQDLTLAKECYKKSCDNGNSDGCKAYERLEKAQ